MNRVGRTLVLGPGLLAGWLMAGCSHRPPKVECDRNLVPINAPAHSAGQVPAVPVAIPEDGAP